MRVCVCMYMTISVISIKIMKEFGPVPVHKLLAPIAFIFFFLLFFALSRESFSSYYIVSGFDTKLSMV